MRKISKTMAILIALLLLVGCAISEGLTTYTGIQTGHTDTHCCSGDNPYGINLITPHLNNRELDPDRETNGYPSGESIKIGVTHASNDNVGQILNFFGRGVDFHLVTAADFTDADRLSEFFAIFINCGSHYDVVPRVLRTYVEQGGIVYVSDLAAAPLVSAFPNIFEYTVVSPSLTVRNANIPHGSLASHMGISELDVIFNMGGWYVITELSRDATVYIEGYVPNHGISPLAISFTYGDGTVFYTSFHNNAQATSHMIDFIEYLVFRIKFIEADRSQSLRAADDGFEFHGQVFGFIGRSSMPAGAPAVGGGSAANSSGMFSLFDSSDSAPAAAEDAEFPSSAPPASVQQSFNYRFSNGQNFMLMVEAHGEDFTIKLTDPLGNTYNVSMHGELISRSLVAGEPNPSPNFSTIQDMFGVRVTNVLGGEWNFEIIAENAAADTVFAIGIATQTP